MAEDTAAFESRNSNVPKAVGNSDFASEQSLLELPPRTVHSECVQEAWCHHCEALECWVHNQLLNRNDVYGQYLPILARAGRSKNFTAPADPNLRFPGILTAARIKQHFCGWDEGHLIGIHAISKANTSRWFAIDIDQHDEAESVASFANLHAARHWCAVLTHLGFHPLIMDSNGNGGLHVWVVLHEPVPTWVVFHFAQWLVADYSRFGFTSAPETFPKQQSLSETCPYGNWIRLPGRHHSRDHWTGVWYGRQWLNGESAIKHLIQATGDDVNILREWLHSHHVVVQSQSQPAPRTGANVQPQRISRPPLPNSIGSRSLAAMPSRLSSKTRRFLLGHFQHESQWNNRLFAAACDMAGNGFSFDEALPQLLRGAGPYDNCERALATKTIESAFSQVRQAAVTYTHASSPDNAIMVGNIEVVISSHCPPYNAYGKEG
ncbi:TOTE conflict system archaeo-eukaryotic primase domain-containing protein [Schlesneria sp.]|uniref:TOTE conflict system archaeo-eukaryotic primase domain-containing protein n=1 Tax=Schlesneria sp. TaxID=2762018 RepID=UPI002F21F710